MKTSDDVGGPERVEALSTYAAPALTPYGTLGALTRGGAGSCMDDGNNVCTTGAGTMLTMV